MWPIYMLNILQADDLGPLLLTWININPSMYM